MIGLLSQSEAPVTPFDLTRMFVGDQEPLFYLEIVVRTLIMYGWTIVCVRVLVVFPSNLTCSSQRLFNLEFNANNSFSAVTESNMSAAVD